MKKCESENEEFPDNEFAWSKTLAIWIHRSNGRPWHTIEGQIVSKNSITGLQLRTGRTSVPGPAARRAPRRNE